MTIFNIAVVEAIAGQRGAGSGDAAVLQQVETWGGGDSGRRARAGGRVPLGERLHGREDRSKTYFDFTFFTFFNFCSPISQDFYEGTTQGKISIFCV